MPNEKKPSGHHDHLSQIPSLSGELFSLEQRMVFDGAAAAIVATELGDNEGHERERQVSPPPERTTEDQTSLRRALVGIAPAENNEIVFIDGNVPDIDTLISGIDSNKEIIIIDENTDGLDVIFSTMRQRDTIDAIHIISHGEAGSLSLGNMELTRSEINNHADDFASLGNSLTEQADILIYGCDFGANDAGQEAIDLLAALTQADVAASNDTTGHHSLGGDWDLEVKNGTIEAELAISNAIQSAWAYELADLYSDAQLTVSEPSDVDGGESASIAIATAGTATVQAGTGVIGVSEILDTVWQYSETGDPGQIDLQFDLSTITGETGVTSSDFALVVSDNADPSLGTTYKLSASGLDGDIVRFNLVDLPNGAYFTLATGTETDNFQAPASVTTNEDTSVSLGITVNPALTQGGDLPNIIDTAIGFRASDAGTTPTEFIIPAGATGISITGFSTRNENTNQNDIYNDDYQTLSVNIDIASGTSSGLLGYVIDRYNRGTDQYGWEDADLGSAIGSGSGMITGNSDDGIAPTFSIVDGKLQIIENHGLETAYHIEFLTSENSSSELAGVVSDVQDPGVTQSVLDIPIGADYIIINDNSASAGSNFQEEYKGYGRIYIDLATLTASGSIAAERGETDNNTVSYSFENYDISSSVAGGVLNSGADIVGDTTANAATSNSPNIYINAAGQLVIERPTDFADEFTSMYTVESYNRVNVGSAAAFVDVVTDHQYFDAGNEPSHDDPDLPVNRLNFDIPESARIGIFRISMNPIGGNSTNENMGSGFAIIDLENGTSSGSFINIRTSAPDLVSWDGVPNGNTWFSDPNSSSNHNNVSNFVDGFGATGRFEVITNSDGTQTLFFAATSGLGSQSYRDYQATGQVQWLGNEPFKLSGVPVDGSLSAGTQLDNGDWEIDINDIENLSFSPSEHVSGQVQLDLNLSIGNERENITVNITPVADAPTLTTSDVTGLEDTDIDLSSAISTSLVDQDGSESFNRIDVSGIPIGHTLTDGTNTFTASLGDTTVDVKDWTLGSLIYRAPENAFGTFPLTVTAETIEQANSDTATTSSAFNVIITSVVEPATLDLDDDDSTTTGNDYQGTFTDSAGAVAIVDSDITITDADHTDIQTATIKLTNAQVGDSLNVGALPIGITSAVNTAIGGEITITLSGAASLADYQTALQAITFDNASNSPDRADRVIEISVNDGDANSDIATSTLSVVNPAPIAGDDTFATNEDTAVSDTVLGGDSDPDADTLSVDVAPVSGPSNGTLVLQSDGNFTYTPDANFTGVDSFTYTLIDADGGRDTATVTITVNAQNDAPDVIQAIGGQTGSDADIVSLDVSNAFSDREGDTLTFTASDLPAGLTISSAGVISGTIDPSASQSGNVSNGVYNVTITADDGNGGLTNTTFTWNVGNVAPVLDAAISRQVDRDADTVSLAAAQFFSDADGDNLSYTITGLPTGLTYDSNTGLISGTLGATASTGGTGSDGIYTINITADDSEGGSVATSFTWEVNNQNPVVSNPTGNLSNDDGDAISRDITGVFANPDDDPITYGQTGLPPGLTLDPSTGIISGTIDPSASQGASGSYVVTLTADDGSSVAEDTFTWTINNPAPTLNVNIPDQTGVDNLGASIDVSSNFTDPEGDSPLTYNAVGLPPGMSIDTATGVISGTFDNSASAGSPYTVVITVSDGEGGMATDTFSWSISNPAPVAADDAFSTDEDTEVTGQLLTNDTDPDGDDLTVITTPVVDPANGTVTLQSDGSFTYEPEANFSGTDTFTYQVSDGEGGLATAVATITVTPNVDSPAHGYDFNGTEALYAENVSLGITDAFTIDVVLQSDGTTNQQGILSYASPGSNNELLLFQSGNRLSVYINGAVRYVTMPRDTEPHRFTVTMDQSAPGDPVKFFVDGELMVTRSYSGAALSDGGTLVLGQEQDTVGGRFHNAQAFKGTLYSVDLWNSALTDAEVAAGTTGGNLLSTDFSTYTSTNITNSGSIGDLNRGEVVYTSSYSSTITDLQPALEDQSTIAIDLNAGLLDTDGSETLVTTISAIPLGVTISDGVNSFTSSAGNTSIDVSGWDLHAVFATPLAHSDADITLTVTSQATETASGEKSDEITTDITLIVKAVTDAPTLVLNNASGPEDTPISLAGAIVGSLVDQDGSETLTYGLSNIPANVSLTLSGTPITLTNGTVTLSAGDIANLALVAPPDHVGSFNITVKAIATESATGDQVSVKTAESASAVLTITTTAVADIVDDTETTAEDTSVIIDVLDNDSFEDTPFVTTVSTPSNGVAVINADGTITYNPDANFSGVDSFTYTVTSGNTTETATVNITVTAENDAPTVDAPLQDISQFDGDLVSLDVSGAFGDIDGGTLTFTQTGLPAGLTMNAAGVISGTVDGSASQAGAALDGLYYVQITADDGNGGTVVSDFSIDVSNRAAIVDTPAPDRTDRETDAVSLDGSTFFSDADGDTPTYSATGLPPGLTLNTVTGEITGEISSLASAGSPYSVTLTLNDGEGSAVSTSFDWVIENLDPTVANPLPDQTNNDGDSVSIDVTDVFVTTLPDTLKYSVIGSLPAGLSIDINTGLISGTIDNSASTGGTAGVYTITLQAEDTGGGTVTDTFTWTIGNPSPAVAEAIPTQSDTDGQTVSLAVAANFVDPDGDTLTFSGTGLPTGLSIDANTGLITGTLDGKASTPGSYNVRITANDGEGGSTFIDFVWLVDNPAPLPVNDGTIFVPEDTNAPSIDVLSNDSDPDNDTLTITFASALNGTVSINGDGTLNYTPNANYVGSDTISYKVTDADGGVGTAQVTIEVTPVNDIPTIEVSILDQTNFDSDTVSIDISSNFDDVESDTLTFKALGLPPGLTITNAGVISGTLIDSASQGVAGGVYTVLITADDGTGGTITDTVTWTVQNTIPVATGETYTTAEDTPISGNILTNDTDADGDTITINTTPTIAPTNGSVTLEEDGSFTYIPDLNYAGIDSFTYQVVDQDGGASTAVVNITVSERNDPPITNGPIPPQFNNDADVVSLSIAGNFTDVDDSTLVYTATNLPDGLSLDSATGLISGTLTAGSSQGAMNGIYQTAVTATDADGASQSLLVEWTVSNIVPVATGETYVITEDSTLTGTLLPNDTDADGDTLTVNTAPIIGPSNGTLSLNSDGTFEYMPDADFFGIDGFTYQVEDGNGGTDQATVSITVTPINDAPVAVDDSFSTIEATEVSGTVLTNDSDVDNELSDLVASLVDGASNGVVLLNADGSFSYTPTENFNGTDQFVYMVSDGKGGTTTATVTITIDAVYNPDIAPIGVFDDSPIDPIDAEASAPELIIEGIIEETSEDIDDLDSIDTEIGVSNIVQETANSVASLNGLKPLEGERRIVQQTVDNIEQRINLFQRTQDSIGLKSTSIPLDDFQFAKLRLNLDGQTNDPSGVQRGYLRLNAMIKEDLAIVELYTLSNPTGISVVEVSVSGIGSDPLPAAVRISEDGMVTIDPDSGETSLDVLFEFRLSDGTVASVKATINTLEGRIDILEELEIISESAKLFTTDLLIASRNNNIDNADLLRALGDIPA